MYDFLLLGGIALCALSVVIAIVQLLQTRPPRAAAITLVIGIAALLAGAWLMPQPLDMAYLSGLCERVLGWRATP